MTTYIVARRFNLICTIRENLVRYVCAVKSSYRDQVDRVCKQIVILAVLDLQNRHYGHINTRYVNKPKYVLLSA